MMLDSTPGSTFKHIVNEKIKDVNSPFKARMCECPGRKWIEVLKACVKSKKRRMFSPEENCMQCQTKDSGDCRSPELCYEMGCCSCLEKDIRRAYSGESGRNGKPRGKLPIANTPLLTEQVLLRNIVINSITVRSRNFI